VAWADAAAALGDEPAAAILYERLLPFEGQGVTVGAAFHGTVGAYLARLAAVLGHRQEAEQLFERADRQLRALGAPFWQARNQVEWARMLIVSGTEADAARAGSLLSEATTTAAAYGCQAVERRAEELTAALS
jgi:hypothetical protein